MLDIYFNNFKKNVLILNFIDRNDKIAKNAIKFSF